MLARSMADVVAGLDSGVWMASGALRELRRASYNVCIIGGIEEDSLLDVLDVAGRIDGPCQARKGLYHS